MITMSTRILAIIDELIEKGDYRSRSSFLNEACRAHLNTWYSKELEEHHMRVINDE